MRIAIVGLAALLTRPAIGAPAHALSVCETVRGKDLDGKIVRIKGVWQESFAGAGVFDELIDGKCPEVIIHVVASNGSLPHPPPQEYRLDVVSVRQAQHVAERALADGRDLSVTIVGVLYVQKREDYVPARPLSKDVMVPPHHKWYPFILLIQSIPNVQER